MKHGINHGHENTLLNICIVVHDSMPWIRIFGWVHTKTSQQAFQVTSQARNVLTWIPVYRLLILSMHNTVKLYFLLRNFSSLMDILYICCLLVTSKPQNAYVFINHE